jgi:hypothetical protein
MRRAVLHHDGQTIHLPVGDLVIGRGLECRIRFNDPAVSRQHVRLVVREDSVVAENVSRTNGTTINGVAVTEPVVLVDGDVIRIGYRRLRLELTAELRARKPSAPPIAPGREVEPGSGILADDEEAASEATRPGNPNDPEPGATVAQSLADGMGIHTCPGCRARISYFDDVCSRCGYAWPPGRPTSRTQEIEVDAVAVRAHPRYAVEVPVVYASATLGIDALVRDLSRGGMFIASDLLDPAGTPCEITALPDGQAAVRFTGVIVHVVQEANQHGRPPGLGVRFTGASAEAARWLDDVLGGLEQATGALVVRGDPTIDVNKPEE